MTTAELLNLVGDYADTADATFEAFTAKFRTEHGLLSVADLDNLTPAHLIPWVRQVRDYMANRATQPA